MYRFQTLGELRALLALYRIGVEEVGGTRGGRSYRGVLYTVLDENGERTQAAPLKASRLGDDASLAKIERVMASSGEQIAGKELLALTRHRVGEALLDATDETELRERLRERHIDLYLRRNDTGRITASPSSTTKPAAYSTARGWARSSRPMRCMNGSPPAGTRNPNGCGSRGAGRKFGRHIPRAGNSLASKRGRREVQRPLRRFLFPDERGSSGVGVFSRYGRWSSRRRANIAKLSRMNSCTSDSL